MSKSIASEIRERMRQINDQILSAIRESTQEQLEWSAGPTAPSIAFHAWHVARWSDRNQSVLSQLAGAGPAAEEVWVSKRLAASWGLASNDLGSGETGLGISDDDAQKLTLPEKTELIEYAAETFQLLDRRFAAVSDAMLPNEISDPSGRTNTLAGAALSHLTHASRHLGMIEALRGVQGKRGTASA